MSKQNSEPCSQDLVWGT